MINICITLAYVLISGFGGFVTGVLAVVIFFRDANSEQIWLIIGISTSGFAYAGLLSALIETRFFPWLLRLLLSLFRNKR